MNDNSAVTYHTNIKLITLETDNRVTLCYWYLSIFIFKKYELLNVHGGLTYTISYLIVN